MEKPLLFLDFDGVLCDSVLEGFASSYLFVHYSLEKALETWADWDKIYPQKKSEEALFRRYRPFIREGLDFIFLQKAIAASSEIRNEQDLEQWRLTLMQKELEQMRQDYFLFRQTLLAENRQRWLTLNPLYLGIASRLKKLSTSKTCFILSTKQPHLIQEILLFGGINWPQQGILYAHDKIACISSLLEKNSSPKALFVDDQISYFHEHPSIDFFWALWGYITEVPQPSLPHIRALRLPDFLHLLDNSLEKI